jgi:hypothetical protein
VVLGRACRCWRPPLRCCADPHRGPQWWTPVMLKLLDIHSCCTRWTSSSSCAVAAVALGQSYAFAGPRLSSLPQHSVRATLHRTPLCCHALADSRTRRYCRHSLFHSLGPALLLLLDPQPVVTLLDPQFVLRSLGPQLAVTRYTSHFAVVSLCGDVRPVASLTRPRPCWYSTGFQDSLTQSSLLHLAGPGHGVFVAPPLRLHLAGILLL